MHTLIDDNWLEYRNRDCNNQRNKMLGEKNSLLFSFTVCLSALLDNFPNFEVMHSNKE